MILGSLLEVITESAKDKDESAIEQIFFISKKYEKLYRKQLDYYAKTFNDGAVPITFEVGTMYVDNTGKGRNFNDEWLYVYKSKLSGKAQFCVVITVNRTKFAQMYASNPKKAISEADRAIANAYRQAMSIIKRDMK